MLIVFLISFFFVFKLIFSLCLLNYIGLVAEDGTICPPNSGKIIFQANIM